MFYLFLSQRFERLYLHNTYGSIDTLPVYYWNKVQESGNLSYLVRTKNVHIEKKKVGRIKSIALGILWRKLLDEFIERFGFSENFLEIARKQKEILRLKIQKATDEDKSVNVFIKIAEEELIAMQQSIQMGNFYELKGALDRAGFYTEPMSTSVAEFYTHVQTLTKQVKQNGRSTN